MKGPRVYDASGIPLHADNESVVQERIYLDKADPNLMHDDITTIDHALTRPWVVKQTYRRAVSDKPVWFPHAVCGEGNFHVGIGKEAYFLSADGYLMPTKKDQPPPDLRCGRSEHDRSRRKRGRTGPGLVPASAHVPLTPALGGGLPLEETEGLDLTLHGEPSNKARVVPPQWRSVRCAGIKCAARAGADEHPCCTRVVRAHVKNLNDRLGPVAQPDRAAVS